MELRFFYVQSSFKLSILRMVERVVVLLLSKALNSTENENDYGVKMSQARVKAWGKVITSIGCPRYFINRAK